MNDELVRLWPRAERILDATLDLPEPERSVRALEACAGDPALERAVHNLLRSDRESRDFLETAPAQLFDEDGSDDGAQQPSPIERIGPFRIVRELGSGGMGTVLLGERDDGEFEQHVAIKLLRHGIYGGEAHEALVRERRILARLVHPGIARMYDGGVTATGEPYFIMEHVDGLALDEFCDGKKLGTSERLRLLCQVCHAVEYAHSRLVVHCDLKPGNILVTPAGQVKLLDFGIARLIEEEGRGRPRPQARVLTPAYAAPEQERGEVVTAATDVYQLGLVLSELMTGRRSRGAASASPRLAGDVDAIVAKALRSDPAERYPTMEAMRRDLEAVLERRPVSARISTTGYRLGRYVSRNRWGVAAASALALSLLAGLIGVAGQSRVAAAERDRARLAESRASAVNDFVIQELLRAPMPEASLGRELTVAEVLGNAARSVGYAFQNEPMIEAELRLALARTYAALGRAADASLHARAARDLLAAVPAAAPTVLEQVERTLAEIAFDEGQYAEALAMLEDLHRRQVAAAGPADPETLRTAAALGRVLTSRGESARAESMLRQALAVAELEHGAQWRLIVEIERPLARALFLQSEDVEAEGIARRMLERLEQHVGPDHPERITTLTLLTNALIGQLRYVEAVSTVEEAVVLSRRIFGDEHPATAEALYAKALALERLGSYDDALSNLNAALAIARRALGTDHPKTIFFLFNLGILTRNSGNLADAETMIREVVEARSRVLGQADPETIGALRSLNVLLLAQGRNEAAREVAVRTLHAFEDAVAAPDADPNLVSQFAEFLLDARTDDLQDPERALALAERAVAATERRLYPPLSTLGNALARVGRTDEAVATFREALDLPDGIRSWSTEARVVDLLRETGTPLDVETFLEQRIAQQRGRPGANERMVAKTFRLLALHLQSENRFADAERAFAEGLAILRRVVPEGNWEIGRIESELGGCLSARGAYAEAEPLLLEGHKILEADRQARRATAAARRRLGDLYEAWGRPGEAERWRRDPE